MIDFSMLLGSVTEIEQGAGEAWKFLLRVGIAAIFAFGAYRNTKDSKAAAWKLHLTSVLVAAALAFIFGGGSGETDMAEYDGLRSFGTGSESSEYEEIPRSKRIETFFVIAAAMAVGVALGIKTRNKESQ
jgi:hypothetical protein